MRFTVLIVLYLTSLNLFSQHYKIEGVVAGAAGKDALLIKYVNGDQQVVDTAKTDGAGYFVFELPQDANPGIYDIFIPPDNMFEVVFNDENIRFVANGSTKNDNIKFIESEENKIYYDYVYRKKNNEYKINLLKPLLKDYPKDDPFYKELSAYYNKLIYQLDSLVKVDEEKYPGFLAVKYIKSDLPVYPPAEKAGKDEKEWLKAHYLDNVDFSDESLINTPFLSAKVLGYLQLYQSKGMGFKEVQEAMKPAIDTLLEKATLNGEVYGWLMKYLVDGFESVNFDDLLVYLADEKASDNICEDETRKEVSEKLEMAKRLQVGAPAPGFKAKDINGKIIDLYKIDADTTVLVFWASWCPHCVKEALPVLKDLYDNNKGKFEVVAVSVDENSENAREAVKKYKYNWITIAEGKGWDGKIPLEYGVNGTPTFFVLDRNKKIIAKPKSIDELKDFLGY